MTGGASGGSIYIEGTTLKVTGVITANGGNGVHGGGGGAGGKITIIKIIL